jgi:hypothetical protein
LKEEWFLKIKCVLFFPLKKKKEQKRNTNKNKNDGFHRKEER